MPEQPQAAEQQATTGPEEGRELVVFAPRIETNLRQQVEGLRSITGQTVNDLGTEALTDWVAKKLADPEIREKAMADINAEERRLQERRAAIEGILGGSATSGATGSGSGRAAGKRGREVVQ